ncbi:MAG: phage holin family protein [Singulisphaera sp.]
MANQASVNLDGSPVNQPEGVVGNIAEFGNDVMTLVELQAQLAALDFKEVMSRATIPLVLIVVGLAILLASLPVALLGVAFLVASALSMSTGWGILLTAVVAAVLAAVVAAVAFTRLLSSLDSFRHTREELVRNVSWLRTVLVHSGRPAPRGRF